MRQILRVLQIVGLMLMLTVSLVGAETANLLVNGDFANELASWRVYRFSGKGPAVVDQGAARMDTATKTDRMTLSQPVKVEAGTTYVLTGQVKTANIDGRGGYVRVQFKNAAGASVGKYPQSADFKVVPDWQEFSLVLTPPSVAVSMLIELFMENCSGTIWYRNVKLVPKVDMIAPSNLAARVHALGAVELSWQVDNPSDRPVNYKVYRAGDDISIPKEGIPIAIVNTPAFTDRTVKGDRSYYYQVVPEAPADVSVKDSPILRVDVDGVEVGRGPAVEAHLGDNKVVLSWRFPTGARASYLDVYRYEGSEATNSAIVRAEAVFAGRVPVWLDQWEDTAVDLNALGDVRYIVRTMDPEGSTVGDVLIPVSGIIPTIPVTHGYEHPYLITSAAELAALKEQSETELGLRLLMQMDIKAPADGAAFTWATPRALPEKGGAHAALARTARTLGLAYHFYDYNNNYLTAARNILLTYADKYTTYVKNASYGGRVTNQTLEEAGWLINIAWAYDLVYNSFTPEERAHIEKNLLHEAVANIQGAPRGILNWQVWHDAGLAAAGFVLNDQQLIDEVLYGSLGVTYQVREGLLGDGLWHEQSISYHLYTLEAFTWLALIAENNGYDVYALQYGDRTFKSMYDVPLYHAFSDLTTASVGDSPANASLGPVWIYGPAFKRYGDMNYAWLLRQGTLSGAALPTIFTLAHLSAYTDVADFAIGTGQIAPKATSVLGSTLLADTGLAILRGEVGNDGPEAALIYKPRGTVDGHQHADNLSLYLTGAGRQWLAGSGKFSYYPGQTDDRHGGYARHTAAKNTLVVDGLSQIPQRGSTGLWNTDSGSTSKGILRQYVPGPTMQLVRASSHEVYPGVNLQRTVLATSNYVLDIYDAVSSTAHRYNWIIHVEGTLATKDQHFTEFPGKLGSQDGMQFIDTHALLADFTNPIYTSWTGGQSALDHWFIPATPGIQVKLGSALWSQAPNQRAVFTGEVHAQDARFVSLFAPTADGAKISKVAWQEEQKVLLVEHSEGHDIITLPQLGAVDQGLSVVRFGKDGAVVSLLLSESDAVAGGNVQISSTQPTSLSAGLVDGIWVLHHAGNLAADLNIAGIDLSALSRLDQAGAAQAVERPMISGSSLRVMAGETLILADVDAAAELDLTVTFSAY